MRRACTIAILTFLATPASAELRLPCLWNPFGGCSFSFVSPEYAKKPVQPLNPEAALAEINAFRAENGPMTRCGTTRRGGSANRKTKQRHSAWIS